MWTDTRIQKLLEVNLPIIQAPMAGASGLEMAAAVADSGGLGSLACATLEPGSLRRLMQAAQDRTEASLNLNFFAHRPPEDNRAAEATWLQRLSPYYANLGLTPPTSLSVGSILPFDAARCALVEEFRPAVASFHFGLPEPKLVEKIKAAGIKVMSTATTVEEARWLVERGCDAVIAQGSEAGGHRGMFLTDDLHSQMGTLSLVPQIVDAVEVPVIAAGGIADGRGISAAFALGASAAQIGTAYLFTGEATISGACRRSLVSGQSHRTAITNVFSGRPTRALVNRMIEENGPIAGSAPGFPRGFAAMAPLAAEMERKGSAEFSACYCGQSAGLGYATSAAQLTRDFAASALQQMNGRRIMF